MAEVRNSILFIYLKHNSLKKHFYDYLFQKPWAAIIAS